MSFHFSYGRALFWYIKITQSWVLPFVFVRLIYFKNNIHKLIIGYR